MKLIKSLENYDTLNNYWEIGRLLVDAQGGKIRAEYGRILRSFYQLKILIKEIITLNIPLIYEVDG